MIFLASLTLSLVAGLVFVGILQRNRSDHLFNQPALTFCCSFFNITDEFLILAFVKLHFNSHNPSFAAFEWPGASGVAPKM